MKSYLAFFFISFTSVFCSSDVLDLTDSNFKKATQDEEIMLIEFYAPWCGHCKKLVPEYEQAATALLKIEPPVKLAKVDCVGEGKATCGKYDVSGYPTLKIFRNGEVAQDYEGGRDAAGIISHMKMNSGPSSVLLKDFKHLEKRIDGAEDALFVGFFHNKDGLYDLFSKVADKLREEHTFMHSFDSEINTAAGYPTETIVMYRPKHMHAKFETAKEHIADVEVSSESDITDFIKNVVFGVVGQLTNENAKTFKKVRRNKEPYIVVYYDIDWKRNLKGTKYWRNRVARVAQLYKDVQFYIASRSDNAKLMTDLGYEENLDGSSQDPVAVGYDKDDRKFKMESEFDAANLQLFAIEFNSNSLKPYVKSEPLPVDNSGPVKVVVGDNFNDIVNDLTKDVLIEFYAPWCGHCKTLEPKYNELGKRLAGVENVVIAKMDATANDVPPPFEVTGFPTIFWVPAGDKANPVKYKSAREVDDFIKFIKKEATTPFELEGKKKKKTKKPKKKEL